ncbi:hypothetical protein E2C01_017451 [Portunus trituberculatus]|uniref:Uncharacterized protein n=1 Tax=Portunus trituberculatus TaxID=210409 RepID=A0A5B7DSH5_PORTR|nr:hypothetical protein [Portunus trituberculatus]
MWGRYARGQEEEEEEEEEEELVSLIFSPSPLSRPRQGQQGCVAHDPRATTTRPRYSIKRKH